MENKMATSSILGYVNWTARILTILFAAFLSIFSADSFSKEYSFWENVFSLFMHLVPVIVILVILAFSWKRPLAGVISYALLGVLYIFWAWGRFPLSVYFMIAGPLFVMSVLYFIVWRDHQKK
jgi:hypothetical protein